MGDEVAQQVLPDVSALCVALGDALQDACEDWRQECFTLLPLLRASRGSDELELRRVYRVYDWFVREALPVWLDVLAVTAAQATTLPAVLKQHGSALRAQPPIVDNESRDSAAPALEAVALELAVALIRHVVHPSLHLARDQASNLARVIACVRAFDLPGALDQALYPVRVLPDPVALFRELLEMTDAATP